MAKYINSPETPFFKKGSNLYNLDKARKLSNKLEDVYLVEGYMDVIGLSPFKNEKTPSSTVNDEKEFYHCFSTAEHGNIFDFLMKTQNLKFGEAVKSLANLAGMRPYTFSKQDEQREKNWSRFN